MHKLLSLFFTFLFLICFSASAQPKNRGGKNAIYAEWASNRPNLSLNYERLYRNGASLAYTYRLGLFVSGTNIYIPIGINLLTQGKASHLELSLIVAPFISGHNIFPSTLDNSDTFLYIKPGIGFRYQSVKARLFAKVNTAPVLLLDPPSRNFWKMEASLYASFSVALGYCF